MTHAKVDSEEAGWPGLKRVTLDSFICSDNKYFLASQEASGLVLGMGFSSEDKIEASLPSWGEQTRLQ